MKVFLFDCDQTIWFSKNNDFISSVASPLNLTSKLKIIRVKDGNAFSLKPGVAKAFRFVKSQGGIIGIVSDNEKSVVINALRLFDIYRYLDANAVDVKSWKGYCPKHKMIMEIMAKPEFADVPPGGFYWFDDKDYSREAKLVGVNFIQVKKSSDLLELVKEVIGDRIKT